MTNIEKTTQFFFSLISKLAFFLSISNYFFCYLFSNSTNGSKRKIDSIIFYFKVCGLRLIKIYPAPKT